MKSILFHRLALSKDKEGVLEIAQKGIEIQHPKDIIRDPYVFEFLGIPQQHNYLEGELEDNFSTQPQVSTIIIKSSEII